MSSYFTRETFLPTKAHYKALLPPMKLGNIFHDSSLIREHEAEQQKALVNVQHYYTQHLSIYKQTARENNNSNMFTPLKDGYDEYRMPFNIGWQLDDPEPDVPSAYFFDEEKALFLGHFSDNKPVNNSHGYQAVWFGKKGEVKEFAYINQNQKLQIVNMSDDMSEFAQNKALYLKDLTAPPQNTIWQQLNAIEKLKGRLPN